MNVCKCILVLFLSLYSQIFYGQSDQVKSLVDEGIAFHDQGNYEKAIALYRQALAIESGSSLAHYELAYSLMATGDYRQSERHCKKVISLDKGHLPETYVLYGTVLDLEGKSGKAIKVYEKGIKKFDDYLLYFNHAVTCLNTGEIDKAYASAIMAVLSNSTHASSHLILSRIMARKKQRIRAMLPLYYFLMLEPDSKRAQQEYHNLRNYMDQGVTKTGERKINITIPMDRDDEFDGAEMMLGLLKASENLEENKGKSPIELFAQNNDKLFKMLGELKKDHQGFWWDYYVTFFYDLSKNELTQPFSYYISTAGGDDVTAWLNENPAEIDRLTNWVEK